MFIGSSYYSKKVSSRANLPKNVKVVVKRDGTSDHAEKIVFNPSANKGNNKAFCFSLAKFDFQLRKWIPKKDSPIMDIRDYLITR
jgi:hypothetical protein